MRSPCKLAIGWFVAQGKIWCIGPIKVNDHDFPYDALFKAVPSLTWQTIMALLVLDTPEFAVDCAGLKPTALSQCQSTCDSGGSNSNRARAWKYLLQTKLCDPYQLRVTVAHYPSKWNRIETASSAKYPKS